MLRSAKCQAGETRAQPAAQVVAAVQADMKGPVGDGDCHLVVTENSVRAENAEDPSIREILVESR
jgi:hypothetical protein